MVNDQFIATNIKGFSRHFGRDADPSPTSSAEVKNKLELYLYSL
jgi:hypothetical protein